MAGDMLWGLLPDHLVFVLLLALMLLDMLRAGARSAGTLVALVLLAACAILLRQCAQGYGADILPGEIRVDRFAVLAKLVIVGSGLVFVMLFHAGGSIKSAFLVCSSLLGAMVVMDSAGFIALFIGIEMLSLPAFALMLHGAGATVASEGAFKYLLLSSVASALILFGIALGYGAAGTLAVDAFAAGDSAQALAAGVLVAAGFFLKAAVFPFHAWAPDAYSGVRVPVTAFLAAIVKGAVILALVRVFSTAPLEPAIAAIVVALSLLSIVYGNLTAIRQARFKRLLAYSSIAHAGYMVFALVDVTGSRAEDLLWYVAIYALTVIVACAAFTALCPGDGDDIRSLDAAFHARPAPALLFGLCMLSLAGIPPLPGFFAKLFVFKSVIASGYLGSAVVAFVGSFIGVTYYLGLFFRLFARTAPERAADGMPAPR